MHEQPDKEESSGSQPVDPLATAILGDIRPRGTKRWKQEDPLKTQGYRRILSDAPTQEKTQAGDPLAAAILDDTSTPQTKRGILSYRKVEGLRDAPTQIRKQPPLEMFPRTYKVLVLRGLMPHTSEWDIVNAMGEAFTEKFPDIQNRSIFRLVKQEVRRTVRGRSCTAFLEFYSFQGARLTYEAAYNGELKILGAVPYSSIHSVGEWQALLEHFEQSNKGGMIWSPDSSELKRATQIKPPPPVPQTGLRATYRRIIVSPS